MAALNDLEVKVGDVLNAYITAPITKKVWAVLGPEFGSDTGKNAVIVRALYGLKSARTAFRAHLASFMQKMGYTSCKADPDLWYKAETRPTDNFKYYAYILCYVVICMHHDPMISFPHILLTPMKATWKMLSTSWDNSSRNITLDLSLTQHTSILTCLPSPPMTMIGPSSTMMYKKPSRTTCLSPWVKTSTFACSAIVTTQERNVPDVLVLVS
jgi:hypothetical protein